MTYNFFLFKFLECVKPVYTREELEFAQVDNKAKNRDTAIVPGL